MSNKPGALLYLSDSRGIYIPRDFVNETRRDCISGADPEAIAACAAGPDCEWYWDAWTAICDNAVVTDPTTGTRYTLYHDGDLWLIPEGMEWDESSQFYAWQDGEEA